MPVKPELKIDWASHEAAKYACTNWHYSKCLPAGKIVKVGAWENGKFIGVVLFGRGATPNLSKPYGLTQTECVELVRVALRDHQTPVSRILSIAIKFFKRQSPGVCLIVSFADTEQGHHGGIYQATNWIYSGNVELPSWIIHGKKIHPRSVVMAYGSQAIDCVKQIDPNAMRIFGIKHRYLFPLDEEIRVKIEHLAKPYPKRVKQAMTGDQPEQRRRDTDPPAPLHAENQPFAEVHNGQD
jgi:hypothetical protein